MTDLESGNENYQKLTKLEEYHDNEIKEELQINDQPAIMIDSPPLTSPLNSNVLSAPKKRSSQQIKALVYKNLQLQSRQIGTNVLQVKRFFLFF